MLRCARDGHGSYPIQRLPLFSPIYPIFPIQYDSIRLKFFPEILIIPQKEKEVKPSADRQRK